VSAVIRPETTIFGGSASDLDEVMITMVEAFDPRFGEAWTRGQCAGILGLGGVWLTLARSEATPAGFALSRVVMDEAELLLLAVRPHLRRAGVGSVLLDTVRQEAVERGAGQLHLEMRDGNPAGLLYAAGGFREIGRRPRYYRGGNGESFDAITLSMPIH
jgi:[ribosomal protein S18]-alanine N-acetyltransferase